MAIPITRLEGEVMKVNAFIVEGQREAVVVDGTHRDGRLQGAEVFAGDVAYSGAHAYLADGQWESWIRVPDRLEREQMIVWPNQQRIVGMRSKAAWFSYT